MIWKFQNLNKIVLVSAILVSSFFLFFLIREQKNTDQPNLYEAVFLGLMTNASQDSQEKILKDLGLQEKGYLINVNKGYWRPGNELIENEQLYNEFYSVVSQKDIIKVYLINPSILLNTATKGLKVLRENSAQPDHLGNYSKKFSKQEQKTVVRSLWGIFLNNLFLPIYLVGLSTALVFLLKKRRNLSSYGRLEFLIFFLVLWIPVLYSAIFVAGGINDFVKHNLPVYFLISVLFLLIWIMLLKKNSEQLNSIVVNPSHGES